MLDQIMIEYRKLREKLIGTASGANDITYEEARFFDKGYMQTRVGRIQKELKSVEDTLAGSIRSEGKTSETKDYQTNLAKRREMLTFDLLFTMSNSFANLDNCRKIAKDHDYKFMLCVEGLEEYNRGNKERAFSLIESYYKEYGNVDGHYLINKVFGLLLFERNNYEKAIPFLQYALGFVPDDRELLKALNQCFHETGRLRQQNIIADIYSLLGY